MGGARLSIRRTKFVGIKIGKRGKLEVLAGKGQIRSLHWIPASLMIVLQHRDIGNFNLFYPFQFGLNPLAWLGTL